jgi:hypothetical protein
LRAKLHEFIYRLGDEILQLALHAAVDSLTHNEVPQLLGRMLHHEVSASQIKFHKRADMISERKASITSHATISSAIHGTTH